MKFYKPKFWDKRDHISLFSLLLLPFSLVGIIKNYYENNKIKKNFYDLKTICVGNIYVGGTGKTPIAIELKKILDKEKIKTSFILSFSNFSSIRSVSYSNS